MYKVSKRGVRQLPESQKGCKACTRHLQRVQGSTRQPKRGTWHVQGSQKGQLPDSQKRGMYKASTKGARIY